MNNHQLNSPNFINDCLSGKTLPEDINQAVDKWHEDKEGGKVELSEALGMTRDEYSLWLKNADIIYAILQARKLNIPINELVTLESKPRMSV